MSLHATITPDAQAKLEIQKRNASISSFIIALLICSLILTILFYIALNPFLKNNEPMVTYNSVSKEIIEPTRPEYQNEVQKKPPSSGSKSNNMIHIHVPAAIAVTVTDTDLPSLTFGDGLDFGDGDEITGDGEKDRSKTTTFIPPDISKRCSKKDRIGRLIKEGGKEDYENKVVEALKWLQKNQASDGSWTAQGKPVAMTGLALLAYLGHCETPASVEFGETVQNAIVYLINNGKKNGGPLSTSTANRQWCYEHAIATYALAEAHTLCKSFKISIPGLEEAVIAAGNTIIGNQNVNGGWAYAYQVSGGHTDTSVVCWQLQALKACKTTELEFNGIEKSADKGIEYLEKCTSKDGEVGYKGPGGAGASMTPGGVLCYQQWGKGKRSLTRKGVKTINEHNKFDYKVDGNLYKHYYASQAMINAGGSAWTKYNKKTMQNLADSQNPDGSWPIPGHAKHSMSSEHYATCLAVLMMEVYYRFLPSSE